MSRSPLLQVTKLPFTLNKLTEPVSFASISQSESGFAIGISGGTALLEVDAEGNLYLKGNASAISSVQVTFSGSQLDAFNTTPLQILPAPGANMVIYPMRVTSIFVQTGPNIYGADGGVTTNWNNTPLPNPPDTNGLNPNSTTAGHPIIAGWDLWKLYATDVSAGINQPLKIQANFDWNMVGAPKTSHLTAAGTGYNPGDISDPTGNGNILVHVDTVTGGPPGPIATYHIVTTPGVLLPAGSPLNLSDVGDGNASIHVDTIQPGTNGKFTINMQYAVLPTS